MKTKLIVKTKMPWRDENGNILNDAVLRNISKEWNPETWEAFLVDTVEASQSETRELIVSPRTYDMMLEEMTETIWECATSDTYIDDCALVRRLIKDHLTPLRQMIIRRIFWDGLSERIVAEIMMISRNTVVVQKRDALNVIKHLLEARLSNFLSYERTESIQEYHGSSRADDIREIYQQEIKGTYGKW